MARDGDDARHDAPTRRVDGSALRVFYATKNPAKLKDSINDLRLFAKFCGRDSEEAVDDLLFGPSVSKQEAQALVTRYRDHLRSKGMAYGTVNRRLTAIRTLVRAARLAGIVSWNIDVPTGDKTPRRDVRGASKAALRMARRMTSDTRRSRRDMAIVMLAHHARLSRAEIVQLELEDYVPDPTAPHLSVGSKKVSLEKEVKKALDAWVEVRGFRPGHLFTSGPDSMSAMNRDDLIAIVRPGSILS